jgi:hypothetical protein
MSTEEITEKIDQKYGKKISVLEIYDHKKASEVYVRVVFTYRKSKVWSGSVPIVYPRGGVDAETPKDIADILQKVYDFQNPTIKNITKWDRYTANFWKDSKAMVTLPIFNNLKESEWKCATHLGESNNLQRRIQDIKDKGFMLATDTSMYCNKCKKNTTHHILLRLPSGAIRKYETWTPETRKRIIKVLGNHDVYEDRKAGADILPDHKFPEIRWDEHTSEDNEKITDEKIKEKFQLINNKRNEQKREACRCCYQTGKRGIIFGINYFYEGGEKWDEDVPKNGKEAEQGCVGCGWYDITKWRDALNKKTNSKSHK